MDLVEACYDEIALEGLEGITLNSLWYRLSKRQPAVSITIDESTKAYYWMLVVSLHEVEFFCLPSERADVTDTELVFDPDARLLVYKEHPFIKMYPFSPVNENGIHGSCSTITTRVNVTSEVRSSDYTPTLSLEQVVQQWGRKFVIVASQRRRELALLGPSVDSAAVLPILEGLNYLYLEAIGRSRSEGLLGADAFEYLQSPGKKISQGKMFYHKKVLTSMSLIYKQDYMVLKGGRHCSDNVCHLVRFFKPLKTFYMDLHDKLEQHLLQLPNRRDTKRAAFQAVDPDGKWTRFKRFLQERSEYFANERIPNSELYPENSQNAEKESTFSSRSKRHKRTACLRLIKRRVEKANADAEEGCDLSDEEEEETPAEPAAGEAVSRAPLRCGETVLQQLADYVQSQGTSGVSLQMIRRHFCLHTLIARAVVKSLLSRKLFLTFFVDKGRQREQRFRVESQDSMASSANLCAANVSLPTTAALVPTMPTSTANPVDSGKPATGKRCRRVKSIPTPGPAASTGEDALNTAGGASTGSASTPGVSVAVARSRTRKRRAGAVADAASTDTTASLSTGDSPIVTSNKPPAAGPQIAGQIEDIAGAFAIPTRDARGNETVGMAIKGEVTTSKMQERMEFIVKRVLKDRVMTFAALAKELKESEAPKYKSTIDRKSLSRLIDRLARESRIKSFKTLVQVEGKRKEHHYICEPDMSLEDRLLQSLIEQERCSLLTSKLAADQRLVLKKKEGGTANADDRQVIGDAILRNPLDASTGRIYGYQPRFRRMEILHKFLWYLAYGYEGSSTPVSVDGDQAVYVNEVTWKRCVPPLPDYPGLGRGWCLLADAIAFMPVSMFLHLVRIPYKIDGMRELLADPLKAVMLVRHLPDDMRCVLMFRRHYATWIYQMAQLLCLAGLLTFGKTTAAFKDMVYIYIHRNVSVKDTTSVEAGYAVCKSSTPLPVRTFQLKDENSLNEYWEHLRDVCTGTPLGHKTLARNENPVIECWPVLSKPSLQHFFKPQAPTDVVDAGVLRGDGLGAGGLDSCFFSHRIANWVTSQQNKASQQTPRAEGAILPVGMLPSLTMSTIAPRSGRLPGLGDSGDKWLRLSTVTAHEQSLAAAVQEDPLTASTSEKAIPGGGVRRKRKQGNEAGGSTKKLKLSTGDGTTNRKRAKTQSVSPDITSAEKQAKGYSLDDVDMQALGNMNTLRSVWKPAEDLMVLLCNVGVRALSIPNSLKLLRNVRDWLHEHCESTRDKSSTACQRRLKYLLRKSPEAKQSVNVFLAYALKDEEILKLRRGKTKARSDERTTAFRNIMEILLKFMHEPARHRQMISLPDSLEKLRDMCEVENPYLPQYVIPSDVATGDDAQKDVLKQVIVGYLLLKDKIARANEMRNVLSYYPDHVLESVVDVMRCNGLLVKPRVDVPRRVHIPQIRYYSLSNVYHNAFIVTSRFHKDDYLRTWSDYCQLVGCESDEHDNAVAASSPASPAASAAVDVSPTTHARCLVAVTLVAQDKVMLECKLPDKAEPDACRSIAIADVPINHVMPPRHLYRAGSATHYLVLKRVQHAIDQSPHDSLHELAAVQQMYPHAAAARSILKSSINDGTQPATASMHSGLSSCAGRGDLQQHQASPATAAAAAAAAAAQPSSSASEGDIAGSDCQEPPVAQVPASGTAARLADFGGGAGAARDSAGRAHAGSSCTESCDPDDNDTGENHDDSECRTPGRVATQSPPIEIEHRLQDDSLKLQFGIALKVGGTLVQDDPAGHSSRGTGMLPNTISNVLQTLSTVVPLPIPGYALCREHLASSGFPQDSLAVVNELYAFVHALGEVGAKSTALEEKFSHVLDLFVIIQAMVKCNMIMRVGTVAFRYVSLDNCDKWVAKSLRETTPLTDVNCDAGDETVRTTSPGDSDCHEESRIRTYEQILFVPRVWRKPNGDLNAEVLANVLSSVMTFAMMTPACSVTRLFERFRKIMLPVPVLEVVEVLEQLGCVRLEETRPLIKPSLFSKSSEIFRKTTCTAAAAGRTCVIPTVDCVLRLGQFMEQLGSLAAH